MEGGHSHSPEDIVVSEEQEVRRVVRESMVVLAEKARALVTGEEKRGGRLLGDARRRLESLLDIMQE